MGSFLFSSFTPAFEKVVRVMTTQVENIFKLASNLN